MRPLRHRSIPYRGENRPKLYGHPSPQKPNEKTYTLFLWLVFIIIGVVLFYFAFIQAGTSSRGEAVFIFLSYLGIGIVMFFALRDLKNIKMLTPDSDDEERPNDKEDDDHQSLAEDYFEQIAWQHAHRKRHHPTRWDAPEPQWRYRRVEQNTQYTGYRSLVIYTIGIGLSVLFAMLVGSLLNALGINSPVMTSILVLSGIAAAGIYLVWQD